MGKSYRRHNKHPKRKNTRRRGRGGFINSMQKTLDKNSMQKTLDKHYQEGFEEGTKMMKIATDTGKTAYKGFKYSSPTNFAIAKTGETAYSTTSNAVRPHYDNMKSSMKSMGSPMGFSSLSTKKPDIKELEHAQYQAKIGTPMQNDPYNQRQMYLP